MVLVIKKIIRNLFLLSLVLCSFGCESLLNHPIIIESQRLYEGPELPEGKTAKLLVYKDGTELLAVNNTKVESHNLLQQGLKFDIEPGTYNLTVAFKTSSLNDSGRKAVKTTISSNSAYILTFDAKAGHIYRVTYSRDDDAGSWTAYLFDITESGFPTRQIDMFEQRGTLVTQYPVKSE